MITDFIQAKLSSFWGEILAYSMVFIIGCIDYIVGPEMSFSLFFLIPVFLVTWLKGRIHGIIISVCSALTWLVADLAAGHIYSHPVIPTWNAIVLFMFFFIFSILLSLLQRSLQHERMLARKDEVSGIDNRRSFFEYASKALQDLQVNGSTLTVFYFDIDDFKSYNDSFGHLAGDELIQIIGKTIRMSVRDTDFVARLGGDEFIIIIPQLASPEAVMIVHKVQHKLVRTLESLGLPVTISAGVVSFRHPPTSIDEMLKVSDELMYDAKKQGKNQTSVRIVE
jgi:diguanylate cyclase (GGDEF)-like protein